MCTPSKTNSTLYINPTSKPDHIHSKASSNQTRTHILTQTEVKVG